MITTHILDTALGKPAAGVLVTLEVRQGSDWHAVGTGATDADGRLRTLSPAPIAAGVYRISFDTGAYFARSGTATFYPEIRIAFEVHDPSMHFHVPLLLSPFGYSTYRGS